HQPSTINYMPKRLILASASPRRRELLSCLSLPFEVIPSGIDEDDFEDLTPPVLAESLAKAKAKEVADQLWSPEFIGDTAAPYLIVIGCDTLVITGGAGAESILGKPKSSDDARRMLSQLSGTTHTVITAVALAVRYNVSEWDDFESYE